MLTAMTLSCDARHVWLVSLPEASDFLSGSLSGFLSEALCAAVTLDSPWHCPVHHIAAMYMACTSLC